MRRFAPKGVAEVGRNGWQKLPGYAYNRVDKVKKAQSLGITDYVQKPLRIGYLGEKVDKIDKELSESE